MIVDSLLRVGVEELSRYQWERLLTMLTFRDAEFTEVQAYDLRKNGTQMVLPRGVLDKLGYLRFKDLRSRPAMPKLRYTKTLRREQVDAVLAMVEHEQGQVIAPPGKGKTEIALAFAASCKTRTLVLVHTKDLMDQWIERTNVSVPGASIGEIKAGVKTIGHITIAMVQTLKNYVDAGRGFWQQFGCLIIDEQHHAAAETYEWILNVCPAYYRFGFTATESRADGRHPLVRFYIGPTIYKAPFEAQVPMEIQPVKTNFGKGEVVYRGNFDWQRMLRLLVANEARNTLIAKRVLADIEAGHSVLVLSRQIKHLERIYDAMRDVLPASEDFTMVTSRLRLTERHKAIQGLRDGSLRCILATQLADEGLDVPRIDRVHLTFPGKHGGRIIQQIGRALRKADDKEDAIIVDYCDPNVSVLLRQYDERVRTYKQLKLPIRKAVTNVEKKKGRTLHDLIKLARSASPARTRR